MSDCIFTMNDAVITLRRAGYMQIDTYGFWPDHVPIACRLSKDFLLKVFPGDGQREDGLPSAAGSVHVFRRYPGADGYDDWRDVKKFPATLDGIRDAMSRFTPEGWAYD